ncbi:hypothetical protein FGB62_54g125 [Gracilaria domingensis]|nr:hypothetical protein FGB62_54g125 [Gracilaria domingensis]
MPVKAVSVNEEVQARRPNTCQWRAAKVLEAANQNHHRVVKLKFIGDTTVHTIPWAHIKLFQYVKRDALFRRSVPSRPVTRASKEVVSIDLTDLEDHHRAQPQQHNSRCSPTKPGKGETERAGQLEYSSSKTKPLIVDPCSTSTSDLNAPLSVSDPDTADHTAVPSDDADTPQMSRESVSSRLRSSSAKQVSSFVENALKSRKRQPPAMHSVRRHTRRSSRETVSEAPKKPRNNELIWELKPGQREHELRNDLETSRAPNGKCRSLLTNQRLAAKSAVPIPRERHPHRALGDIPIPRARPQVNDSSSFLERDCEYNEETINLSTDLTPSKRPRSSSDSLYRNTTNADLSKFPSNGLLRRVRKKSRRFRSSRGLSADHSESLREVVSKSETNIMERFKATERFPFVSENEELEDDVDKLINNGCEEMVDEHKNEVHAMLQTFDELRIKKKPIPVRNRGSRKKSTPKRWADRKTTEKTVFQHGSEGPIPKEQEDMGVVESIPSGLFNSSLQDNDSVILDFRCVCRSAKPNGRNEPLGRATVQCGLCGYWSHLECVGLDDESVQGLRGSKSVTEKHFVCTFCVDDATYRDPNSKPARASGKSRRRVPPPGADRRSDLGEDQEWCSHISPVIFGQPQTKKYNTRSSRKISKSSIPRSGSRYRPRSPLSEAEIQARNENVEFLRSGVLKPSIGLKERELVDGKTPNFSL